MFLSWVVQPLWHQVHALGLHVETQMSKLAAVTRLLAHSAAIARAYQEARPYLEVSDDEQTRGTFLDQLETLAQRSHVQLNLKPRPVLSDERLSRFGVELDVEGPQESLLAFLDALLRLPRLMTVDRLQLSTVPTKTDTLRASLLVHKLTLQ